jgi:RNA polymerase sigma factor (sigma-70 family)
MNTHETSRESGLIRNGNGALTDEQKLVVQAKSGLTSAFGELYERHRLKIYRSAFRILRNEQDAEDAVQQSFQRAFVNLHRFRGDSAFATWVTRIAINEALMTLRRRRVTTPLFETNNNDVNPTSSIDLPDDRPTPEQALRRKRKSRRRRPRHLSASAKFAYRCSASRTARPVERRNRSTARLDSDRSQSAHLPRSTLSARAPRTEMHSTANRVQQTLHRSTHTSIINDK